MLLYANGDSHSIGAMKDGATGKSFVQLVAEHFNFDVRNDSEGASSATRIIRTTQDYLTKNKPQLVLIGWGTWEREEWVYDNQYYNIMVGWYKHLPEQLKSRYNNWEKQQDYDTLVKKSCLVHEHIHRLHRLLDACSIPHLFFNCMYDFQGVQTEDQYDWKNKYLDPYKSDKSYVWYMKNKKYEHDKWYHFAQEAHTEWANIIIKHIETNDLIH
jgi:hypothetical protein